MVRLFSVETATVLIALAVTAVLIVQHLISDAILFRPFRKKPLKTTDIEDVVLARLRLQAEKEAADAEKTDDG